MVRTHCTFHFKFIEKSGQEKHVDKLQKIVEFGESLRISVPLKRGTDINQHLTQRPVKKSLSGPWLVWNQVAPCATADSGGWTAPWMAEGSKARGMETAWCSVQLRWAFPAAAAAACLCVIQIIRHVWTWRRDSEQEGRGGGELGHSEAIKISKKNISFKDKKNRTWSAPKHCIPKNEKNI